MSSVVLLDDMALVATGIDIGWLLLDATTEDNTMSELLTEEVVSGLG